MTERWGCRLNIMQSQNPSLSVHLPVYSRFLAISKDCRHDHGHLCRSVNISNILSSICASHLFLNKIVAMVIFTPPCKSTWSSFQDVLWDWQDEMLEKTPKKLYAQIVKKIANTVVPCHYLLYMENIFLMLSQCRVSFDIKYN